MTATNPVFPSLVPTGRAFTPGDYPVKRVGMLDGFETRLIYGNKQFAAELTLTYQNVSDEDALKFWDHFHQVKGTFGRFTLGGVGVGAKAGIADDLATVLPFGDTADKNGYGYWTYAEKPVITSVYPGVSNVSVKLVGVIA